MNADPTECKEGSPPHVSRRQLLQVGGLGLTLPQLLRFESQAEAAEKKPPSDTQQLKPVAAITTSYYSTAHADILIGQIFDGCRRAGGPPTRLSAPALYLDQLHPSGLGRAHAKEFNVSLVKSIEETITLGTDRVAVEGVLIIGELGNYPRNTKGQTCYPRLRMFEDVVATFRKYGKVVPVFNDKHLSYNWHNAKWIYDTARKMDIPMMAGSSLPVFWRDPPLALPMGCEVEEAMAIGYSDLDSYGFHTMEALQCQLERRKGGETGVAAVQTATGEQVWKAEKQGKWSRSLYEAIMAGFPESSRGRPEDKLGSGEFFFIQYRDGMKATVAQLRNHNQWGIAAKLKGQAEPVVSWYRGLHENFFAVFANQLRAIEKMILTGKPSYPVERTLLTTGIIDAAMTSRFENGRRQPTPHLTVRYQPVDYPFPKGAPPPPAKTS